MKKTLLTSLSLLVVLFCHAIQTIDYKPLDASNPVVFAGNHIVYQGKIITLGPKAFFIDGQLTDEEMAKYPYVFNSVNKAAQHLTDGTEDSPMVLYLAPYVYWIDNPDDPEVRVGKDGGSPYGLIIQCEWLRFHGLSDNAENVVLACNRGQTLGSRGNFTMFKFSGQGTSSENVTFGNYCNIDLTYPLKPTLGRGKRASAIVQAQLVHCDGDKIVARNVRFVSRLNLCPFTGGKRVLFDRCHFESTDDALCGTGLYLNCTLDFYNAKPFYNTLGTGAIFLHCDIRSFTRGDQYFTKANGQVAVLDTRITSETATSLGWRDIPPHEMRNYQYNVTFNGKQVFIGQKDPKSTVDMTDKPILNAYRFVHKGKVVYNTYNLLCGNDDWDPMGVKDIVLAAQKENGKTYTMLPVQLQITPTGVSMETKRDEARLTAKVYRFGNYEQKGETVKWAVAPEYKSLVELKVSADGMTCDVVPTNTNDETKAVIVTASTPSGLEAASVLTVAPSKLDAPKFSAFPKLSKDKNGKLVVGYKLDMKFADQSLISWYRCTDAKGSNPIEVAVSRLNKPLSQYELSAGDVGYYIKVSVAPKHLRCDAGEAVAVVMNQPISAKDVKADNRVLSTDFENVSTMNQPKVIPGFWTLSGFDLKDIVDAKTFIKDKDAWYYGEGSNGSANVVGLLQAQDAQLRYTPVGKTFGDMRLTMTLVPSKEEGQGFSMAYRYMDVLIKFDNETMTGYALRFIRTTKYHDAIDCVFLKYENGKVTEISKPVSTTCYRPTCQISMEVVGNKINAHVESSATYYVVPNRPEVVTKVDMETEITPNEFGGFGMQYSGGSTTTIKALRAEWGSK
jgi:hypothetical protein